MGWDAGSQAQGSVAQGTRIQQLELERGRALGRCEELEDALARAQEALTALRAQAQENRCQDLREDASWSAVVVGRLDKTMRFCSELQAALVLEEGEKNAAIRRCEELLAALNGVLDETEAHKARQARRMTELEVELSKAHGRCNELRGRLQQQQQDGQQADAVDRTG